LENASPDSLPFVSVIMPVCNERAHIVPCLEAVLRQDYPAHRLEVLVAEGRSNDGTAEVLREWAARDERLRVIDNLQRIVSTGLNAAIRAARGSVIVRMDAHTQYATDYVRECVAALSASRADNVGGPWVARGQSYVGRAVAAASHSPFAVGGGRCHDSGHEGPVDTVYLGCWRKTTLERFGLFDEELVRNQDDEHNLRLTRAGGRVWQSPRIRSWYTPRGSLTGLFRQYMQYGYWKVRVIQKHRLPASPRYLVPGLFVLTLALLAATAPFSTLALAAWAGLAGLYLSCLLAASVLTSRRAGLDLLPVLPAVFCCYHFGYGVGFLRGVWDFVLWRRVPGQAFTALTRTSVSGDSAAPVAAEGNPG
jgi:glycosyltransferase involved in cell wall biosynthesis